MSNHNRNVSTLSQDDRVIQDIQKKILREKGIAQGAISLKKSTRNVSVQQKCDTNIREAQKNIEYLEERLQQLHIRKRNSVIAQNSNTSPDLNSTSPFSANSPSPYSNRDASSPNADSMYYKNIIFSFFHYHAHLYLHISPFFIFIDFLF